MQHMGVESFDYDVFKTAYDQDPILQALTKDFNEKGIKLNTKKDKDTDLPVDGEANPDLSGAAVHDTAIQATRRHMGR
jgi:hypothetical protein